MPYQGPPSYAPGGGLNPQTGVYPTYPSMGRPASQSQTLTTVLGDDVEPVAAKPSTRLQQSLMRNVSPRYAVNRWFMAVLGAVVAAIIGLLITFLMQSYVANTISSVIDAAAGSSSIGQLIGGVMKGVITPDTLKLFAIEHRIPLLLTVDASSSLASGSGDMTLSMPVTGLLLIPAIGLLVGGYVSAASDFRRVGRYSTARGALIGPFYGVILALLAFFGSSSSSVGFLGVNTTASVSPVAWQAFLYGLLWGVIFGGLGGWIQYAGSGFLQKAIPTLRERYGQTLRGARMVGAISGALVAVISGLLTSTALLVALLAYEMVNAAQTPGNAGSIGPIAAPSTGSSTVVSGLAQLIIFLAFVLAPTLAAYVFALSAGASFQLTSSSLLASSSGTNVSWGLFSGQHILPPNAPQWIYLVALIPAVCFFAGGRVAARAVGAGAGGDGIVAGALMAIPASVLMALLAYLSGWGVDVSIGGQTASASASPGVGSVFLTTLVVGAVLGGIGGLTVAGVPSASAALRALMFPFIPLVGWMSHRLDNFTRYPRGLHRSTGRQRLYDAVLAAVGLGVIALALDILNVTISAFAPFQQLIDVDATVAGLLVIIPSLLLVSALATAFGSPALPSGVPWSSGLMAPLPAHQFGAWPAYGTPGFGTPSPGSQVGAAPVGYESPRSAPMIYAPPSTPVAESMTETAPQASPLAGAEPESPASELWRPPLPDAPSSSTLPDTLDEPGAPDAPQAN